MKKWKVFAENERAKIEECASKFYNFEQNLRNRLINGMEKCLKIEKIHIFQQKMVAFATKQNIDFRLMNNTRQYIH